MQLNRPDFLKYMGISVTSMAFTGCLQSGNKSQRPNIMLMMADDLCYGDVGFNGNTIIKTPHLDVKFLTNFSENAEDDLLFDLIKDRAETTNLIETYPEVAAKMKTYLREWFESCRTSHTGADYPTPFESINKFPAITTERV
jgi:hypothetical protein